MPRIGVVDTGVNPWHSHVRGAVEGCRVRLARDGTIVEDDDWSDPIGHGTAIAGVIREAFPEAALFAVRVFDEEGTTYPSLVARGILRALSELAGANAPSLSALSGLKGSRRLRVYDTQTAFYFDACAYPIPDLLNACPWIEALAPLPMAINATLSAITSVTGSK